MQAKPHANTHQYAYIIHTGITCDVCVRVHVSAHIFMNEKLKARTVRIYINIYADTPVEYIRI